MRIGPETDVPGLFLAGASTPSGQIGRADYAPRARGAWAYTELVMEVIDRE
jgi:hypothetical protein